MLKTRILTATALLLVTLLCFLSSIRWLQYSYIAIWLLVACWEWLRLAEAAKQNRSSRLTAWIMLTATAILFAVLMYQLTTSPAFPVLLSAAGAGSSEEATATLAGGTAALWGGYMLAALHMGTRQTSQHKQVFYAVGFLLLLLTGCTLLVAFERYAYTLLSAMTLVWSADTGAYFSGRAYGSNRLAPDISPGKTWEGVWGALISVYLLAAVWIGIDATLAHSWLNTNDLPASVFTTLWQASPMALLIGVPALLAASVCGDLVESMAKRMAEVKDSSQLLPGHGGVLDRIDALLPTLPLALAFVALAG